MESLRFLHVGDVHIGRERLGGALPSRDFADVFDQAVSAAIEARASFVLVAGDFFDKARIEPDHLAEGEQGLRRLKNAGIPVVAIEGNHDVVSTLDPRPSWLTYLNRTGLLRLLRTTFRDGAPVMKAWTPEDPVGNYTDIGPARIYGAGWFGSATARRLERLAPLLVRREFTVLLLHAGVNGFAEEGSNVTPEQLAVVRPFVDYVALGHVHRRYVVDGYAYNPGALENWRLDEAEYGDEKGYWLVDARDGGFTATHAPVRRRPVLLHHVDCGEAASIDDIRRRLAALPAPDSRDAVIHVTLLGRPRFNPDSLDRRALARELRERTGVAGADIATSFSHRSGEAAAAPERFSRDEIEAQEIERLLAETGRYEGRTSDVAAMIRAVLDASSTEDLFGRLRQLAAPLIDKETHENPAAPAAEREILRG